MNANDEGVVKVIVRLRPLLGAELTYSPLSCMELSENLLTIYPPGTVSLTFTFDKILSPISAQEEVYSNGPLQIIESVMEGFNGTIFTYGQVSSGKTYTMFGDQTDPEKMGIIPRVICTIFDMIDSAEESAEFLIKVSFCEIYMEKVFDLLNPKGENLKLKNGSKGVFIEDLREVYTTCDFDIHELIKVGLNNKQSRDESIEGRAEASHTIFSITISQTVDRVCKVGTLFLVDLAGSEKVNASSSPSRVSQAKTVNTSLTTLGIVINALTEKSNIFIPYRASKLTRILQESLGGNSKTVLIITCSPSPLNVEETISSLRFGTRVKAVKNFPIVNREQTLDELKQQYLVKVNALKRANRKLNLLQMTADKAKGERNSLTFSSRPSISEDQSPKFPLDFSELHQELEEVKIRTEEQEKIQKKLENEIAKAKFLIIGLDEAKNLQLPILAKIESQSNLLEIQLKDAENQLETALASVDLLNAEYEEKIAEVEEVELKLDKIVSEAEHSKCQLRCMTEMRSSLSTAAVEEQLRRRVKEEKDKNKAIKEEIKKTQYEIDLLLFKKYKNYVEADQLQSTGKRIFELELSIDKARMKYMEDEKMMSLLQRQAKTQRDALSLTADKITKKFRTLTSSFSESQLEKLIFQKKSGRLEEKCAKLEQDIEKVSKKLARVGKIQQNCSHLGELNKALQRNMKSSLASRRLQYSLLNEPSNK